MRNISKTLMLSGVALSLLAASGCATVMKGSTQNIYFTTDPEGASCSISRDGREIYSDIVTPTSLEIEKDKDELTIVCDKEGYKQRIVKTDSEMQEWTLGNLLIGGIVGVAIDAGSGAMNEYPSQVTIPLEKE